MKEYGYIRVSTKQQSLERQRSNIKAAYPGAVIIEEKYTGTTMDRPAWSKLEKKLSSGDRVIFDEVSRMSRDAEDGFRIYKELYQRGVDIVFLKEPHCNTATYKSAMQIDLTGGDVDFIIEGLNKYLLALAEKQIRLAFDQAQAEVEHIHKRTSEGIREVKAHNEELKVLHPDDFEQQPDFRQVGAVSGKKLTTKKELAALDVIRQHSKDFGGSLTDAEVIKLAGISRNSFYKYKAELRRTVA